MSSTVAAALHRSLLVRRLVAGITSFEVPHVRSSPRQRLHHSLRALQLAKPLAVQARSGGFPKPKNKDQSILESIPGPSLYPYPNSGYLGPNGG